MLDILLALLFSLYYLLVLTHREHCCDHACNASHGEVGESAEVPPGPGGSCACHVPVCRA